jgi:hypothetical protein
MRLDGIWARAPYLHNGSVPTLRALLDLPCAHDFETNCRPRSFYRGIDLYDIENVGFVSDGFERKIKSGDTVIVRRNEKEDKESYVVDPEGRITVHNLNNTRKLKILVGDLPPSTARKRVFDELHEDRLKELCKGRKELIESCKEQYKQLIHKAAGHAYGSLGYAVSRSVTPPSDVKVDGELKTVRLAVIGKKRDSLSNYVDPGDTIEVRDLRKGEENYVSSVVDAQARVYFFDTEVELSRTTIDDAKEKVKQLWHKRAIERKKRADKLANKEAKAAVDNEFAENPLVVAIHKDKAQYFRFDTTVPGNSNTGHLYGTDLTDSEKDDLVEFMKGL